MSSPVVEVTVQFSVCVTREIKLPKRIDPTDKQAVADYVCELDFTKWRNSMRRADAEYEACDIDVNGETIYDSSVGVYK